MTPLNIYRWCVDVIDISCFPQYTDWVLPRSKSQSRSPTGRLYSSTFASRAKQEQTIAEEGRGSGSRVSQSPQR